MASPTPPTVTLTPQSEIAAGKTNAAQDYNDNVAAANASDVATRDAFIAYASRPVLRTINGVEPDPDGEFKIPPTVIAQALTTTQRDALAGAELILGRLIYNTTVGKLQIYGNSGWRDTAPAAKTTTLAYTPAGLLATVIETDAGGAQLRKTEFFYTAGTLSQVTETAGSATRSTALTYAGDALATAVLS